MRYLIAVVVAVVLVGSAWAQPPVPLTSYPQTMTVTLSGMGQLNGMYTLTKDALGKSWSIRFPPGFGLPYTGMRLAAGTSGSTTSGYAGLAVSLDGYLWQNWHGSGYSLDPLSWNEVLTTGGPAGSSATVRP